MGEYWIEYSKIRSHALLPIRKKLFFSPPNLWTSSVSISQGDLDDFGEGVDRVNPSARFRSAPDAPHTPSISERMIFSAILFPLRQIFLLGNRYLRAEDEEDSRHSSQLR